MLLIKNTKTAPIRYKAFVKQGVFWINSCPKPQIGSEYGMYYKKYSNSFYPDLPGYVCVDIAFYPSKNFLVSAYSETPDRFRCNCSFSQFVSDIKIAKNLAIKKIKEFTKRIENDYWKDWPEIEIDYEKWEETIDCRKEIKGKYKLIRIVDSMFKPKHLIDYEYFRAKIKE